jgi:hypothetical protein
MRSSFFLTVAAISTFVLVLLALQPELFSGNSARFIGSTRGDPAIYISIVEQFYRTSLWRLPSLAIFYPAEDALFYSDLYLLPGFVGGLISRLTGSLELGYNLPIVAAFILNGISVFALCRTLGVCSIPGALSAATAFMMTPFFREHLTHPQLQFFFFVPFSLILAERFSRVPSMLNAVVFWLVFAASFLTGVYFGFFCAIFGGLWLLLQAPKRRDVITKFMLGGIPAGVILFPFANKYLAVREKFGERTIQEIKLFSADFWSYLSAPPALNYWGQLSASWSHGEGHLFPGSLVLFLGMLGLFVSQRYRLTLILIGLLACFLSLGPDNFIFSMFSSMVPGFGALRAVSRFGLVFLLCLSLFAGVAVSRCRPMVGYLVLGLIAFELQMSRIHKEKEGALAPVFIGAADLGEEPLIGLPLGAPWHDPTRFAVIQTSFWRSVRRAGEGKAASLGKWLQWNYS